MSDPLAPATVFTRRTGGCDFLGLQLRQNVLAYPTWNYVLLRERPRVVIELGTGKGGLSLLLGATCQAIGAELHTFDLEPPQYLPQFRDHGVVFHREKVLAPAGRAAVAELLAAGKAVLLCDNGNKVEEFRRFAPHLKQGDLIAAHDFVATDEMRPYWNWSEIETSQVAEVCRHHSLRRYRPEWFDYAAWLVFARTGEDPP